MNLQKKPCIIDPTGLYGEHRGWDTKNTDSPYYNSYMAWAASQGGRFNSNTGQLMSDDEYRRYREGAATSHGNSFFSQERINRTASFDNQAYMAELMDWKSQQGANEAFTKNSEKLYAQWAMEIETALDKEFMKHAWDDREIDYNYSQSDYMDSKRIKWTYESQNELSEALGWGYLYNDKSKNISSLCHAASLMEAHDLNMGDDRTLQDKVNFLKQAKVDKIIETNGYIGDSYKFVKSYAEFFGTKIPTGYATSKTKGTTALYGVGRYNGEHSSVIMSGKTTPLHNPWTTSNYGNNDKYKAHAAWFKYEY